METFGKALAEAILKKGWTQKELAMRTGISTVTISQYVTGKRMPIKKNYDLIIRAFSDERPVSHITSSDKSNVYLVPISPLSPSMDSPKIKIIDPKTAERLLNIYLQKGWSICASINKPYFPYLVRDCITYTNEIKAIKLQRAVNNIKEALKDVDE